MKCYIYHIPLLIAAMLVAGCDNIFSGNEEGTVTLTLSTSGAISKAGMDQGLGIVWENNDEVLINGERYRVSPEEQDLTSVSVSGVYESDGYLAIYPYSRQYTAGDSYLVDIPAEQAYGTDMPVESYPMIGYSTSTDLQMSGVCGIVRIGVNGTGQIGSVTVTGGSADDILSGTLTIPAADVTGGSLKGSYSDFYTEYSTSGSVTVSIDRDLQVSDETRYIYAAIPARTYSSGLKITFGHTSGNTTEIETESGVTVGRAAVTDLGTFTLEGGEEEPPVPENPVSLNISHAYDGNRPYAETGFIILTENASYINCTVLDLDTYETEAGAGLNDVEIIDKYSQAALDGSQIDEANSGGYLWTDMFLSPAAEYIFMAVASNEESEPVVMTERFYTDDYLPEALDESVWNTISTDAYMECGFFNNILTQDGIPVSQLPFSGLTVQQLGDQNVFRIMNPFQEFWGSLDGVTASGDRYIMIDARDHYAVKIEWWESRIANYLGIIIDGDELYIQSSLYTGAQDGMEALGTYDPESRHIEFGDIKVLAGDAFIGNAEPTLLWFENPYPVDPDPVNPGFSTEDFELVNDEW